MSNFFQEQVLAGNLLLAALVSLIAGVISFFSPCVLPLIPGYLSYATGMSQSRTKSKVAVGSILFVLGFSILFISYGAIFGSLGSRINTHSRTISIILGILTIAMGIIFIFSERFYRSFKPQWKVRAGLTSAPLLGFLFGIGWTPCIGPTLGAVQTLSLSSASALRGAILSSIYCLGLGLPLIFVGIFFDQSEKLRKKITKNGDLLSQLGGSFLIAIGILQVTGLWDSLMNSLRGFISGFGAVI